MPSPEQRRALAASTIALAAMLAACSGGEDSAAPTTTGALGSTTSAATGESVVTAKPVETEWDGRRDPCALVSEELVERAVGFAVTEADVPADVGGTPNVCGWANRWHGMTGGSVTLTVVPPGTDLTADEATLEGPEAIPDLPEGFAAVAGQLPGTLGEGFTAAIVTTGDTGFTIAISTYEVRELDELEVLVREAITSWIAAGDASPP